MTFDHIAPTIAAIHPGLAALANGRDFLNTDEAAHILNRSPQTLRLWSCQGGPISPVRFNRRLAWRVSDLSAVLRGEAPASASAQG